MKKILSILALFSMLMLWGAQTRGASFIPTGTKSITQLTTVYAMDIARGIETGWAVIASVDSTGNTTYTNTSSDVSGNPTGIVDNIPSTSANVIMLKVATNGNVYNSIKKVVHMKVTGSNGFIVHGRITSASRGLAVSCKNIVDFPETSPENSAVRPVVSLERATTGSFLMQYTSMDADSTYVISVYGSAGDAFFYAIEFLVPTQSQTPTITANPTDMSISTPVNATVDAADRTIKVSGSALTGNLSLRIQAGGAGIFGISGSTTLTPTSGTLDATDVVLTLGDYSAQAGQTLSDTLVISGGGAATVKVPLKLAVTAADVVKPTAGTFFPANSATNVAINIKIYAVFDKEVTVNKSSSVTISNGAAVSSVVASADTLYIVATLAKNTSYTVTLGDSVVKDASGNMSASASWLFTTDGTAPVCNRKEPVGEWGAPIVPIRLYFNEKVKVVDALGITANGIPVSATVEKDTVLNLGGVAGATTYAVNIDKNAVTDISGNALSADIAWSFTTKSAPAIADYPVAVMSMMDMQHWTNGPADNAASGTYDIVGGKLEIKGPKYKDSGNKPNLSEETQTKGADTAYYIRVGSNTVITNGVPTNHYLQLLDTAATGIPFVQGGIVALTVSNNNSSTGSSDPSVVNICNDKGVVLGTASFNGQKRHTVYIVIPDSISGLRRLYITRTAVTFFVWKIEVKTNASSPFAQATPNLVDLSSPEGDGASKPVVIKANPAITGSLSLAMKAGASSKFTVSTATVTAPQAKAGFVVNVTLPTTVTQGSYTDTLLVTGGGLAAGLKVAIKAVVSQPDFDAPKVVAFFPAGGSSNVATTTALYAKFNEEIGLVDAINPKVTVAGQGNPTVGNLIVVGDTLKISLGAALATGEGYTVTIKAGAVKDLSVNANTMPRDTSWSFTTDGVAPILRKTSPEDNAVKVGINIRPTVTFNEKVKALNTNLTAAVMPGNIAVTLSNANDTTIAVTLPSVLSYLTSYTLTIPASSIADISGNAYNQAIAIRFSTKKEVTGLFYTDFSTTPTAMAAKAPDAGGSDEPVANPTTLDGMTIAGHGSNKLQATQVNTSTLTADNPAYADASDGCLSLGGSNAYIELPAVQGPCKLYFYHSSGGSNTGNRGINLTANGVKFGGGDAAPYFPTTGDNTKYRRDSVLYTGLDMVTFRLTSNNSGMRLFDILVKAVTVDTDAPVLTFDPANNATGVSSNKVITIAANKPMYRKDDKTTKLTQADLASYVTLKKGTDAVTAYTATLSNDTIKLTPTGRWTAGTTYTVRVDSVSNDWGYKSAPQSASFTITSDEVLATAVSIDNKFDELTVNASKNLSATVTPSNATNKSVVWSVQSGASYVTFDAAAPSVTGKTASGAATVKIRATAQGGTNVFDEMTFYVVDGGTTSVAKAESYGITVQPNPTSGMLYVKSPVALKQVKVFALSSGSLVYTQAFSGGEYGVDLSAAATGSYILLLFPENGKPAALQVVKQ